MDDETHRQEVWQSSRRQQQQQQICFERTNKDVNPQQFTLSVRQSGLRISASATTKGVYSHNQCAHALGFFPVLIDLQLFASQAKKKTQENCL